MDSLVRLLIVLGLCGSAYCHSISVLTKKDMPTRDQVNSLNLTPAEWDSLSGVWYAKYQSGVHLTNCLAYNISRASDNKITIMKYKFFPQVLEMQAQMTGTITSTNQGKSLAISWDHWVEDNFFGDRMFFVLSTDFKNNLVIYDIYPIEVATFRVGLGHSVAALVKERNGKYTKEQLEEVVGKSGLPEHTISMKDVTTLYPDTNCEAKDGSSIVWTV